MTARKNAALPRRAERRSQLIRLSDVEHMFDEHVIKGLARTLRMAASADIVPLGESVRAAVRVFLEAKRRLSAPKLRATIERLYQLSTHAKGGNERAAQELGSAIDIMPADVRTWLEHFWAPLTGDIPTGAEINSPATRQSAIERLCAALSHGGLVVVGRKRPGGKRSRSIAPLLNVPAGIERKRPRGEAEREFVQWLALAYWEGTGKKPPSTAREASGPFCNFVAQCFELVGAPSGNVPRLINEFGRSRRANKHETGCH